MNFSAAGIERCSPASLSLDRCWVQNCCAAQLHRLRNQVRTLDPDRASSTGTTPPRVVDIRVLDSGGLIGVMRLGKIRLPGYRTVPPGHGHPDLTLRYSPGSSLGQLGSPELSAAAHRVWTHQARGYYPPDLHGVGQYLSMADPTHYCGYATQTTANNCFSCPQAAGTIPRSPRRITLSSISCGRLPSGRPRRFAVMLCLRRTHINNFL